MVRTTSSTTSLPRVATLAACPASCAACEALSALCRTCEVISSMLEAVCTSAAACCSVRCDRSVLPAAISVAPTLMFSVPWRTRETISMRPVCIVCSACSRLPWSSPRSATCAVRSPRAMRLAVSTASSRLPPRLRRTLRSTSSIRIVETAPSAPDTPSQVRMSA